MAKKNNEGVLERGNIYFFYRPKVEKTRPRGEGDVERFYVVLSPEGKQVFREIIIGRKALPDPQAKERNWGFVNAVVKTPRELEDELGPERYRTKTRGEREVGGARPAGEGVYAIVRHDGHTHLAYELELPEKPGEVQREFEIEETGSFVISVKNPEQGSPPRAGLRGDQKADFPKRLRDLFGGRRFIDLDPPDFLDYPGAEVMLIGADEKPSRELGIELGAQKETGASADVFRELRLEGKKHPVKPLFEGKWE